MKLERKIPHSLNFNNPNKMASPLLDAEFVIRVMATSRYCLFRINQ